MTMPQNNTMDMGWTPEPELKDPPPRRVEASGYPDLNRPNVTLFVGIGIAAMAGGLILLIVGLSSKNSGLSFSGGVLAVAGALVVAIFPQRARAHDARAQHLVETGLPVIARVLSAENLTGSSTYGRVIKYQVTMPGGDLVHRQVNCDERALPKRIPADTTALVDMNSGDVELYCALPFRAALKTVPAPAPAPTPTPTPMLGGGTSSSPRQRSGGLDPLAGAGLPTTTATPAATAGAMGTIDASAVRPQRNRPAETEPAPPPPAKPVPVPEQKQEQSQEQTQKTGPSTGLPWE